MHFRCKILSAALFAAATTTAAQAAVTLNVSQNGNDVLVSTAGSVDLSGLVTSSSFTLSTQITGSRGYISGGIGGNVTAFTGFTGPRSFGNGGVFDASISSGTNFALNASGFGSPLIFLPVGYVSNAAIAASQTYTGQTFASLGLTTGSYIFRSSADTVTVNIGSIAGAVPEAGTWAMMIAGVGAIGYAMRRRKKVNVTVRFA